MTYILIEDVESSSISVVTISTLAADSGDVTGPGSATDEAIARFNGSTGKQLQSSIVTLTDDGILKNVSEVWFDAIGDYKIVKTGTTLQIYVQGALVNQWG